MLVEEVKKLDPLERLVFFIKERESIRIKKEGAKPLPWTTNEILQSYRFCNVRRMDDAVSKWLLREWYAPNFGHRNIVLAATLARQLNNIESLTAIGFPTKWNPTKVEAILNTRAAKGLKNFSAAYMITGTLGGTKIQQIVWKVVDAMAKNRPVLDEESIERSCQALLPYAGFSSFISGQVVADLRFAMPGIWADKHTWAAIGPGSRRGMNRLLGRDLMAPMKQTEFNGHLTSLVKQLKLKLPTSITSRMEAIDYQNTLCEADKMCRVLEGTGRPKQLYKGI